MYSVNNNTIRRKPNNGNHKISFCFEKFIVYTFNGGLSIKKSKDKNVHRYICSKTGRKKMSWKL